jgi:UDP-N-acetylmuramate dehydrogenase
LNQEIIDLVNNLGITIKLNANGADYTTIKTGGSIKFLLEINNILELTEITAKLKNFQILGCGSNLLINDKGTEIPVIKLEKDFKNFSLVDNATFEIGAGASLMLLSRKISSAGYSGLEFSSGIPGSFGGAVFMNAGAHGDDISNILQEIKIVMPDGRINIIKNSELKFEYRKCILPKGAIIVSGLITLVAGNKSKIENRRRECLEYRNATQPLTLPSFGSVFRNPNTISDKSAGSYIEECGLKGKTCGGAKISEKHANWIVNHSKKATSCEVKSLIEIAKLGVKNRFDIDLTTEVVEWN